MKQEIVTVEGDEPTIIDALHEDAAPREMPKDAPALWPYLKLPFRRRSKFFGVYRALQAKQAELVAADKRRKRGKQTDDQMFAQAEALYDLYALMDDLMEIAAVDTDAYHEWVESHSDEEFSALFSAYVERSQPGEASSSAN
jgi:hypothetical protein